MRVLRIFAARRWLVAIGGIGLAVVLTISTAGAYIAGGWPETCLEMNDMVEASPQGSGAVGIYQGAFGDGAEAACQRDHLSDVQTAFAWAMPDAPNPLAIQSGHVLSVYDGDTITVEHHGVVQNIRYHGVFAPELREADGERARGDNLALVPLGSTVTWQPCYKLRSRPAPVRGKPQLQTTHDRIVARVMNADGVSVNDVMVANVYGSQGAGANAEYPSCVPS